MGLLFYTLGLPGAGKSSLAQNLSRWHRGVHLQADHIGLALFVVPTFSEAERHAVYQHMDYQAIAALNKGLVVLYDGTINAPEQREHLRQLARAHDAQAIGLWLTLPTEAAKERAGRLRNTGGAIGGRMVPPEIFDRHVAAFRAPEPEELVVQINGEQHFSAQYEQLRRQLLERGIPDMPRFVQL